MDKIRIRCKLCNNEIQGQSGKTVTCGCPNMASIRNNQNITALDLSQIIMVNQQIQITNKYLKNEDLMWQEERKKRKFRKLDFEVR
jgi:hypothetical protein